MRLPAAGLIREPLEAFLSLSLSRDPLLSHHLLLPLCTTRDRRNNKKERSWNLEGQTGTRLMVFSDKELKKKTIGMWYVMKRKEGRIEYLLVFTSSMFRSFPFFPFFNQFGTCALGSTCCLTYTPRHPPPPPFSYYYSHCTTLAMYRRIRSWGIYFHDDENSLPPSSLLFFLLLFSLTNTHPRAPLLCSSSWPASF